jgi:uncharacterized iron-regulated membrane protein
MNRILFFLHRWLGLLSGAFLLLIGVSGSFLVYSDSLDRLFNPALHSIIPSGRRLSLDSAYQIVYSKYAVKFEELSLDIPATEEDAYEFTLEGPGESYYTRNQYIVDVHPYTGTILREGYCNDISTSFVHWLMWFHDSLHLGRIGMLVVALASVSLLFSVVTGVLFYGRRVLEVLAFRLPLRQPSKARFFRALHIYVGVWAILFNALVFSTGFWMIRGIFSSETWGKREPGEMIRLVAPLDSFLDRSRDAITGFVPDYVAIPLRRGDLLEIDGNLAGGSPLLRGDANEVAFDPETGGLVRVIDMSSVPFPRSLSAAFWPLHIGSYGGEAVRVLYVIGGMLPGVLSVSGFLLWRYRRRLYLRLRRQE